MRTAQAAFDAYRRGDRLQPGRVCSTPNTRTNSHCENPTGAACRLANCGGFDRAFAPTEVSDCGLLADHARATAVQERLRAEYPDEHHADCDVRAVWQVRVGPSCGGVRV